MVFSKSGQHYSFFRRNGNMLTCLTFLGQALISQVLITQYSLISAAVTTPPSNELFSTEFSTDVTVDGGDMEFLIGDTDFKVPTPQKELFKALRAENNDSEPFQDLAEAGDKEFQFSRYTCYLGACSFRVIHSTKSFVIKQHTVRSDDRAYTEVDPNLLVEIVQLEYKALQQRSSALPGLVPKPYLLSLNHRAIVMEDFSDYTILVDLLVSGEITNEALHNFALAVAALHSKTYNKVDAAEYLDFLKTNKLAEAILKAKYTQMFSNATVDQLKERGINYTNIGMLGSQEIVEIVNQLYINITENKEATLHGMLTGQHIRIRANKIKLLGNQFAMVGHRALDVGTALSHLFATYYIHMTTEQDKDAHKQVPYRMINASIDFIETYMAQMNITDEEKMKEFVSIIAGCAGVELVCWSFTETKREIRRIATFESGMRLISASSRIDNSRALVNQAFNLTQ